MIQTTKIKRVKIIFLSLLVFVLAMTFAMSNSKTEATSSVTVGNREEDSAKPQEAKKKPTNNPRSIGCVVCHTGSESMHIDGDDELDIGCADCHGGDPKELVDKKKAHIQPRTLKARETANPTRIAANWNK